MTTPFQAQRFELKYILNKEWTPGIRDFIQPYLELDSYGARQADHSYPVHSLYLDSSNLALHQSTINGDRNRFKMRVRWYERESNAPVYFEIKRRENNAIYKERCPVLRPAAREILAGRLPSRADLPSSKTPEAERGLQHFCQQLNFLNAKPITHVSYRREAWHGVGDARVRVTFDRQVRSCPEGAVDFDPRMGRNTIDVFGNAVVLELKFTSRFPEWMKELVRVFGLRQCSAAKYVDGILGMERLHIFPAIRNRSNQLRNAAEGRMIKQLQTAHNAFQHHPQSIQP